jgi:hypothetical protein
MSSSLSSGAQIVFEDSSSSAGEYIEELINDDIEQMVVVLTMNVFGDRNTKKWRRSNVGRLCIPRNRILGRNMLMRHKFTEAPTYPSHLFCRHYRMCWYLFCDNYRSLWGQCSLYCSLEECSLASQMIVPMTTFELQIYDHRVCVHRSAWVMICIFSPVSTTKRIERGWWRWMRSEADRAR